MPGLCDTLGNQCVTDHPLLKGFFQCSGKAWGEIRFRLGTLQGDQNLPWIVLIKWCRMFLKMPGSKVNRDLWNQFKSGDAVTAGFAYPVI